jgi:hypothetical protein
MPSVHAQDRVHLCRYTYADHRKCLTPRSPSHQHFCYFHARRESQSTASAKLADDLSFFFSGRYTSANDLSAALGRLLVAVVRGEIKPGLARTISYMMQTMLQTIQVAQKEYIYAFGTPEWGYEIRNNAEGNFDHFNPPDPSEDTQQEESCEDPEASASSEGSEASESPTERSENPTTPSAQNCHPEHSAPQSGPRREGPAVSSQRASQQPPSQVPLTPLEATLAKN